MRHTARIPTAERPAGALGDLVRATKAVGDPLRARILRVLREESYSVSELCHLFEIAQPALSHHLKVLHQAGLVAKRREGNNIFYSRAAEPDDSLRQGLFQAVDRTPLDARLATRTRDVEAERRARSVAFFTDNAARFADQQALISEASVYVPSVLEMVHRADVPSGPVLEIGPGEGELLTLLADEFGEVLAIDSSARMLARAADRLGERQNVRLKQADFADLGARRRFAVIIAAMVVHHMASPRRFFQHARALLKRRGVLVVAELCRHGHQWVSEACGDQWLGFEPAELGRWAAQAGLEPIESRFLAQKNGFRIQIHSYRPVTESR